MSIKPDVQKVTGIITGHSENLQTQSATGYMQTTYLYPGGNQPWLCKLDESKQNKISIEKLHHQKTNLEIASKLDVGQLLTGLEVR